MASVGAAFGRGLGANSTLYGLLGSMCLMSLALGSLTDFALNENDLGTSSHQFRIRLSLIFCLIISSLLLNQSVTFSKNNGPELETNNSKLFDLTTVLMAYEEYDPLIKIRCTEKNHIAITFDDGLDVYNQEIRDTFDELGLRTTLFVNGNSALLIYSEANVEKLRSAYRTGHHLASHTWSHSSLTSLNSLGVREEMLQLEVAFRKILGIRPKHIRPPFGDFNKAVHEVMREFDYQVDNNTDFAKRCFDQVAKQRFNNAMVMCHENYRDTGRVILPYGLTRLLDAGYKISTLGECVGSPDPGDWYDIIGEPEERDSSWHR